jgi:hypothetical protein
LAEDAARRCGRSGQALFDYFSRLEGLREHADGLGRDALAERAARAETHTRILLGAGLDALNELHDCGLVQHAICAAITDPDQVNGVTVEEAVRRAAKVLAARIPEQNWDWLMDASRLLSGVKVRAKPAGDNLRMTLTQGRDSTAVLLSPTRGSRVDLRTFFSDGAARVFASSTAILSRPKANRPALVAYDGAVTGLTFAREWVYRHARNASEVGDPATTGAGVAALVIVIIVAGVLVETAALIQYIICEKDNDPDACKWAKILGTLGFALLSPEAADGSRSNTGTDPYFQYGSNPQ